MWIFSLIISKIFQMNCFKDFLKMLFQWLMICALECLKSEGRAINSFGGVRSFLPEQVAIGHLRNYPWNQSLARLRIWIRFRELSQLFIASAGIGHQDECKNKRVRVSLKISISHLHFTCKGQKIFERRKIFGQCDSSTQSYIAVHFTTHKIKWNIKSFHFCQHFFSVLKTEML